MPVFSVVNALARSLGLESDGATSKKLVDSTLATRTSSTDSNTTAVDATEVEVDKVVDGSGLDSLDVADVVVGEKIKQDTCDTVPTDQVAATKPLPSLQVRRGMVEPLGVEAPATYADATNLASQFPNLKDAILALPLSPKKLDSPTAHTPERPNWASAPNEPKTPPVRERRGTPRGRGRARGKGPGGNDTRNGRPSSKQSSPMAHGEQRNKHGNSQPQPRSRASSRSPRKAPITPHERSESNEAIVAPSPTYICLPPGSSVVVGDSRFPSGGGVPTPADVDALIRELQNSRGLGEAGSVSTPPSRASSPDKIHSLANGNNQASASQPVTEVMEPPTGRIEQGGVSHSDLDLGPNGRPLVNPETTSRIDSLPTSQHHSRASSPRPCTPSPLRHTMLHRVNDILEQCRERSRSQSPSPSQIQQELGRETPSRVASPLRETTTLPPSPTLETPPVPAKGRTTATPTATIKLCQPLRMPTPPIVTPESPKVSVMRRPVTTAGPDIFKPKGRWPTLDEVLATQTKPASTSDL